jgi:tripartite-type tricarboxylate transporter receptor subunit TctC
MFNHLTTRKQFLHLAAGAAALPAFPRMARAQAYPARPVRIIVRFPAGATDDITARLIGQWLSERMGQNFLIDNRSGAAGGLALEPVGRGTLMHVHGNQSKRSCYFSGWLP